jgi:hypothetical protein
MCAKVGLAIVIPDFKRAQQLWIERTSFLHCRGRNWRILECSFRTLQRRCRPCDVGGQTNRVWRPLSLCASCSANWLGVLLIAARVILSNARSGEAPGSVGAG